jgi:hypothetical protein
MSEFNKDQFDAQMRLAEFKKSIRDGRRQFEWKFTGTTLAALAALSVFPATATLWMVILAIVVLCPLHTGWIIWNQNRSEEDRVEMNSYKDAAERMLLGKARHHKNDAMPFYKQLACMFEILTVYLVAVFSILVRWHG